MRVGIVCPYSWDTPGGVQVHIRDLTEALVALGHDVSVLSPADDESDLPDYVTSTGRPVALPYNGSVARINLGVRSTARIRAWIREGRFEVLHVHEPMSPSISMTSIWAAQGPIVATWHSSIERSRALTAGFALGQTVMEKIRGRIAVSELARRTLVAHLGGDAVLIPNGVNCSHYARAEPFEGWPGPGRALMFLGRIDESRKGLPILLAALPTILRRFPDLRVVVVGPGEIDDVRASLPPGLDKHMHFLGLAPEEDKVRAYHSVDLYVAPNTGGESFGIVLLEAMASGTAVLASDIDAFARVLDGGSAGRLFANGDAADLAAQVIDLLEHPEQTAQMAARGRERAWLFDWGRVAKEVVDVYASVTSTGELVTEDLRGQFGGRWARRIGAAVADRGRS